MDFKSKMDLCRLCLNAVFDLDSKELGIDEGQILGSLLIEMNLKISKRPIMCKHCLENLGVLWKFKTTCLSSESYITPLVNEKPLTQADFVEIYKRDNNHENRVQVSEDQKLCRLCLEFSSDGVISLDINESETNTVRCMVNKCVPEMNMDVIKESIVCKNCYGFLEDYIQFMDKCAEIENRINYFCHINGTDENGNVNLCEVVEFNSKNDILLAEETEKFKVFNNIKVKTEKSDTFTENDEIFVKPEMVDIKLEHDLFEVQLSNFAFGEGTSDSGFRGSLFDDNPSEGDPPVTRTRNIGVNTEVNTEELIASLQNRIRILEQKQDLIGKLFSSEQMKKLEGSKTRLRWSVEDVSKSIVIYSAGPRAYRLLLKKGYPFPAVSTLRSWLKKIQLFPGVLKSVFNIMKVSDMSLQDKICVLSFDEMKIHKAYLYDKVNDETMKPYSYVQVVMLRGLFRNWKQLVFYDFDFKLSKEKLFEIIRFAQSSGFEVVAMVTDLGGGNRALLNELNITHNNTSFINPYNNENVYVFADVPHLLKLLRNHFVDHGFIINGKEINKSIIEDLLIVTGTSGLKISHKISMESLNAQGAARQKVKTAAKLFSHTISMAISWCGTLGILKESNWVECAEIFKLFNDWFDVMNARVPTSDSRDGIKAYGLALSVQEEIIDRMTVTMKSIIVKDKKFLLPFQKGVIMSNTSLKLLFEDLRSRFSIKYLLTYRLNQDALQNFFGTIRAQGGLHDHPDALQFKYRLRSYVLGRNEGSLSTFGNVGGDGTPDLPVDAVNLCGQYFSSVDRNNEPSEEPNNLIYTELSDVEYGGLENLARYICHKLKSSGSAEANDYTWVTHPSDGGLSRPSPEFMLHMAKLENIFQTVNSHNLFISKNYIKKLLDVSSSIMCSDKVKNLFFRSRMFFRMRQLNKDLRNATISRKRKMSKIKN